MKAQCEIKIEFSDSKQAEDVLRSVQVDDLRFVDSKTDGKTLFAKVESDSVSSMIHTLDDYLACVSVASKVVDKD